MRIVLCGFNSLRLVVKELLRIDFVWLVWASVMYLSLCLDLCLMGCFFRLTLGGFINGAILLFSFLLPCLLGAGIDCFGILVFVLICYFGGCYLFSLLV